MLRSPFPGMDPWLERHWGDVHHRLVNYACDQIEASLPPGLVARMEERVYLEFEDVGRQRRIPGVVVLEHGEGRQRAPAAVMPNETVALAEPLRVGVRAEPVTEGYIEIVDAAGGGRVLTVIEVLSPANKLPGTGQRMYLDKQRELRAGGVSLVEIDLLRGGDRVLSAPPEILPGPYRTTYQVCARRGSEPDIVDVYRVPLRERLPAIRIPLRSTDPDAPLDLQPLVNEAYRKGRYGQVIDYRVDPEPPLAGEDARWADEVLKAQGLR